MNLQTVKLNLLRTIQGKEALLEEYKKASLIAVRNNTPDRVTIAAMAGFLSTNIDELRKILADVDACIPAAESAHWAENPDRSGGQFTQDEIDNAGRWI